MSGSAEMTGLSYFAIQIQSCFLKQSQSKHIPIFFSNVKSKSKCSPKYLKNSAFSQQKWRIYFPLTKSKSGPGPKFWRLLQSGSNPNSTKFAIVRIQSNPSPVQCSSLRINWLSYFGIQNRSTPAFSKLHLNPTNFKDVKSKPKLSPKY